MIEEVAEHFEVSFPLPFVLVLGGYAFILLIDKVLIDAHDDLNTAQEYDSNAKTGKFVMLDRDIEDSENELDRMLLSDGGADLEIQRYGDTSIQNDLRDINKKVSISFTGDIQQDDAPEIEFTKNDKRVVNFLHPPPQKKKGEKSMKSNSYGPQDMGALFSKFDKFSRA